MTDRFRVDQLLALLGLAILAVASGAARAAEPPADGGFTMIISPDNGLSYSILRGDKTIGQVGIAGWGPNWTWAGISTRKLPTADEPGVSATFVASRDARSPIVVTLRVARPAPDTITLRYDLVAEKDAPLTELVATLGIDKSLSGQMTAGAGDRETTLRLPLSREIVHSASRSTFGLRGIGDISIAIDPPSELHLDGDVRYVLAQQQYKAGRSSMTLTLVFPAPVALLSTQADVERLTRRIAGPDWFPFHSVNDNAPGVIGMSNWLDVPAGKHGGVRTVGDRFQFADGTPVKFWGTNLAYGGNCAPAKDAAEFTAARFAKYGINAVRLHKFTYPTNQMGIGDLNDSTKMDAKGLDRLDYFAAQLRKNGVYYGWSHTFGLHVRPGDRGRLAAYDEIIKAHPDGNTYALINIAEDVQDLMIDMVGKLLRHKNPYTGLTYAEDPALCFIEMQNEDDIFFYTSEPAFNSCPTYKKLFMKRFAGWLRDRYQSQENLAKAWAGALKPDETLAAASIVPQCNPWFFSDAHLPQVNGGERQRLLDTAAFLHDAQNRYYSRFLKAIRDAGYKGPVNGSPWQAPSMLPHYYNLRSDYLVGYIDRHNYFGGGLFDTMLSRPGSGYFSSGLQQVIDRPFGLSEWIHVYPSLYSAEGPAIVAAYGLGLQGWDCSYEFQSQAGRRTFGDIVGRPPFGVWEADTPTQLGQFPALGRMIYRGDVKESDVISTRRLSLQELSEGRFSFSDKVAQQGDIKTFTGSVPARALAAGRVVVQFTDKPEPSTSLDLGRYEKGSVITSATGQLAWDSAGKGFFTINTDGTKAVVGFAEGRENRLGGVTIRSQSPYASIFLTALDRSATLADGRTALLTAIARTSNSGFTYFEPSKKPLGNGTGPILLEPVRAEFTIDRPIAAVNILDHDGRRTGRTLRVRGGSFSIDTAAEKTIYYEVVFQ